ncbi:MAG TPA: TolC family protein [Gammaproteobacteria bacterium]|nr:TolC family protein [Gammaproteobacteria bacterium]
MVSASATLASDDLPLAPQSEHPYTLMELTDMALTNNPQTKLAWDSIRESQAGVELARAGYWPLVTADYSYTRSRAVNFSGTSNPAQTRYGPSISLSYLLWNFGTRSGTLDSAKYALAAAELSNSQTLQDVILAVEQNYYQVLGLQALVQADTMSEQDAETNLDAVHQNQKSGLATIGDVYTAQAAQANTQLALQTAQGQLAIAQGTLAISVGSSVDTQLPLAPWEQNVSSEMPPLSVQQMLQQAREARPELLASKAGEQQAIANLEAARGQGWPSLSFAASDGRLNTKEDTAPTTVADNYSAGLTLSIPLFAGFGDEAANHRAQAQVDIAQATTVQLQLQVELEVWQAYQNMHTAAVTLTTADSQLKSAQQAEDVEIARYHIGLDPILNLLTAQQTLANARVQQVQARLNWFTAQAALGHAVGGLDAPTNATELP